jgi:hypothetical protein
MLVRLKNYGILIVGVPLMFKALIAGIYFLNFWSTTAKSTPLIAIRESQNCQACHESGRSQLPVVWRKCTLDCQGCHIDPNGAGARNQWGEFYTHNQMAIKNIIKEEDPLKDATRLDAHIDMRQIYRASAHSTRSFPMATSFTLRARPVIRWLHLVYTGTAFGRVGQQEFSLSRANSRRFRDSYFMLLDSLPMNLYLKVGRSPPVYGLRRSNHSLWIREKIGLDEFATTDSINFGGTPNVPFFHVSKMLGDPYAPKEDRQVGTSFHAGLRGVSYGWNVNGSGWKSKSEKNEVSMTAFGGGFHTFNTLFYAERNLRTVQTLSYTGLSTYPGSLVQPSSLISEYSLSYTGIKGVMLGSYFEQMKTEAISSFRQSIFLDVHPIPWIQLEAWRRREFGTRTLWDSLLILHFLKDF